MELKIPEDYLEYNKINHTTKDEHNIPRYLIKIRCRVADTYIKM